MIGGADDDDERWGCPAQNNHNPRQSFFENASKSKMAVMQFGENGFPRVRKTRDELAIITAII